MAEQAGRLAYAHGSAFTTEPLEAYAAEVGPHLPVDDPAIYPVSRRLGGDRDGAQARPRVPPRPRRARPLIVFARWGSYHGNTLGALDLSGRKPLRRPYEGWLGRFRHVSRGLPVPRRRARLAGPGHDRRSSRPSWSARSARPGPGPVAAFVAEPIVGATLAAVVPPDGYWPAIAEVCRRHGVLLIADEVMTGFGRTGALVRARPLGRPAGHPRRGQGRDVGLLAVRVRRRLGRGLRHGDRAPAGSSTGSPTRTAGRRRRSPARSCGSSRRSRWSRRSRDEGRAAARRCSATRLGEHPAVGEIRGRGLMVGVELVARPRDAARRSRAPRRLTEAVVRDRPRARACCSTRGPATPTASTATRSCSGRRSWSRTRSSCGSPTGSAEALDLALAGLEAGAGA